MGSRPHPKILDWIKNVDQEETARAFGAQSPDVHP